MSQLKNMHPEPAPDQLSDSHTQSQNRTRAPLWVAPIAALFVGIIYSVLPARFIVGPSWLPLVLEIIVILPSGIAHLIQHPFTQRTNRISSFILLGVITAALTIGVALLVITIPERQQGIQAISLLRTGVLLYVSNILVFAIWYWEIDGSGAHKRSQTGHRAADLLFPQQVDGNSSGWIPHFFDYLFVAFTESTALSPTDTLPLTRRAKVLFMIQASIAVTILTIIIGRAINIV